MRKERRREGGEQREGRGRGGGEKGRGEREDDREEEKGGEKEGGEEEGGRGRRGEERGEGRGRGSTSLTVISSFLSYCQESSSGLPDAHIQSLSNEMIPLENCGGSLTQILKYLQVQLILSYSNNGNSFSKCY